MAKEKLNTREVILLRELTKGSTLKDAAIRAGYSAATASQGGHQALSNIKEKMPQVLNRLGLTGEVAIKKYLLPLLEAEETVLAQHEGKFTDSVEVKALGTRTRALDMLFRLSGAYAEKDSSTVAVQVNITNAGGFETKD